MSSRPSAFEAHVLRDGVGVEDLHTATQHAARTPLVTPLDVPALLSRVHSLSRRTTAAVAA